MEIKYKIMTIITIIINYNNYNNICHSWLWYDCKTNPKRIPATNFHALLIISTSSENNRLRVYCAYLFTYLFINIKLTVTIKIFKANVHIAKNKAIIHSVMHKYLVSQINWLSVQSISHSIKKIFNVHKKLTGNKLSLWQKTRNY